jgi:hypothetical protein
MKQHIFIFQGKRKDNGQWVTGGYFLEPYSERAYIICWNSSYGGTRDFFEVYPKSVGFYTGKNDMKGNAIYSGDVLNIYATNQYETDVIFQNGQFLAGAANGYIPLSEHLQAVDFESCEVSYHLFDKLM